MAKEKIGIGPQGEDKEKTGSKMKNVREMLKRAGYPLTTSLDGQSSWKG